MNSKTIYKVTSNTGETFYTEEEYRIGQRISGQTYAVAVTVLEDPKPIYGYGGRIVAYKSGKKESISEKEYWRMTYGEYMKDPQYKGTGIQARVNNRKFHRRMVQRAVSQGKPVPPEVLDDYPELKKRRKETLGTPVGGVEKPIHTFSGTVHYLPKKYEQDDDKEKKVKFVKLACGKHWGQRKPGESLACRKCAYLNKLHSDPKFRKGLQYGGTPFTALLGDWVGGKKMSKAEEILSLLSEQEELKFFRVVDQDERGIYRAHIEDEKGRIVFEYSNEDPETGEFGELWLITDGYIRHKNDMHGLEDYLTEVEIIPEDAVLVDRR